jgi:hypothetical protein
LVLGSSCTEQQKKENAHSGDRDSDWCMFWTRDFWQERCNSCKTMCDRKICALFL